MADNVQLNSPTTSGALVATDEISGVQHQKVKIEFGEDGVATMVSAADPLPVSAATLPLPTGAATETTLASINGKLLAIGATSTLNSTSAALNTLTTFTGTAELNNYSDVLIVCKTDQDGTLYAEFSVDGTNWDSSISFIVLANSNEIHRLVKGSRYYRARFTNTAASNQTFLRLSSYFGSFPQLTSSLNSVIQKDADAAVVRA